MIADLHTPSTASDGQYTPTQLVEKAKATGIQVMALTDHDTLDGLAEAAEAGKNVGLTVLRGVELGAKEHKNLHLLGYGFSQAAPQLSKLCQTMRDSRDERKYRIVDFLAEKGLPVSLEEVEALAGSGLVARPHFARVMVAHGYVKDTREAFDRYLDTDEYQRIERIKASAKDCVAAIHSAGGKAVLAHPYQLKLPDAELERLVAYLKENGLDGLECHYPQHTAQQKAFYLGLAEKYGLHVSSGSDFHGPDVRPDNPLTPREMELDWLLP